MFSDFMPTLALEGVKLNLTLLYTLQQDGVAEMLNGIIVIDANVFIKWANCQMAFWVSALEMEAYCPNCTTSEAIATTSTNREATSYKLWCCQNPNIKHLRVQGCITYIMMPKEKYKRIDEQALMCMFVGYRMATKQYHCLELNAR